MSEIWERLNVVNSIILLKFTLIFELYSNKLIARISHDVSGGKREYTRVAEYRDVTKGNGWVRLVNEIYIEGKYSTVQLAALSVDNKPAAHSHVQITSYPAE